MGPTVSMRVLTMNRRDSTMSKRLESDQGSFDCEIEGLDRGKKGVQMLDGVLSNPSSQSLNVVTSESLHLSLQASPHKAGRYMSLFSTRS